MDSKMGEWEQNNLIHELIQGRELAKLLQMQLNTPSSSSSHNQARGILVQNIISSYEKGLSLLNSNRSSSPTQVPQLKGLRVESPHSLSGSLRRDQDSDHDVKDPREPKEGSMMRKKFPRGMQKVRVSPGAGLERQLDDGFSWRKYGQKDIRGAKYPRGYYSCTHRNGKGCLATKQVQRSDEDPTVLEITYRGNHTCAQPSESIVFPPTPQPETQEPNTIIDPQQHVSYQTQQKQQQPEQALMNLKNNLKIVTQDLDINPQQQSPFPPYHFPSPSPSTSMVINSNFTANFSPSFMSPQASGSTHYNFQSSPHHSELNEIISGAAAGASTSATNSPTVGLDFPLGDSEYDPNFTFDNLGFIYSFQPFEKQSK